MRNPNLTLRSRRSLRLPGYNYRQAGVYFVTLCTFQKAKLFGVVVDGEVVRSSLGKVVREEWQHVAKVRSNVQLDQFVVMPNHLHGLIFTEDTQYAKSSQIVAAPKCKDSRTLQAGSLGAIIGQYKLAVTRSAKLSQVFSGQKIWQRNYHEHIVRSESSLDDIRRYIVENPARWVEDDLYVE